MAENAFCKIPSRGSGDIAFTKMGPSMYGRLDRQHKKIMLTATDVGGAKA